MIETIGSIITLVFLWLMIFFYGVQYGSGKHKFYIYGLICFAIGEIPFVMKLLTGRIIFPLTLEENIISILLSVIYLTIAFVLGYIIGRKIEMWERMNKEERERKIKSYEWEIKDCKMYIEELLTKEESGKIDTDYAVRKLKTTRESLKYYQDKLDKLYQKK